MQFAIQNSLFGPLGATRRLRRRSAGRCTARVGALRPTASRYPAFLSHANATLGGFTGFTTRGTSLEL